MLLASALILLYCFFFYGVPLSAFFVLAPAALAVFLISLVIGHFLTEPLTLLARKTAAYLKGKNVSFAPDGRIREADELAVSIDELAKKTSSTQNDLSLKDHRQAEFVSDVAHELRTPLTAIRGNAELLQDPDLPPSLHQKFTDIIISESERLTRLVNDLLTLQRIENGSQTSELSRINLRDLAQSVVDALGPILAECQANVRIIGEAPDVLGNPDRLKQAITNLVANATHFIQPGGHIDIELCGLKGNSVIQVKDDGAGFGDVDPKLLFDRFYRTDVSRARNTGGTGLGLAIVKSIVEAHDGTVEAVNRPEGGACFIVAIPSINPGSSTR